MIKHSQITQSNKFAISFNISKKKLEMDVIFDMQINVKVSTSWYYPFSWKWPVMFKIPKIRVGNIFAICSEKIVATFLCSIMMKNIQIFYSHVRCYLLSIKYAWFLDFFFNSKKEGKIHRRKNLHGVLNFMLVNLFGFTRSRSISSN